LTAPIKFSLSQEGSFGGWQGARSPRALWRDDRRLRLDRVDPAGSVTLRHQGRLHHIGIGRAYAGWKVAMLIEGLDIEVVGLDGSPLRRLVLDPSKNYQRQP